MPIWSNRTMGRNGWIYWAFVLCLAAPIFMFALLASAVLDPGWRIMDRTMIAGALVFIAYVLALVMLGLKVASQTAKRIELTAKTIRLLTFSGRGVQIDMRKPWTLQSSRFTRKYHAFLFQKDREHLVIQDESHICYISAYTEDFAGLSNQLASIQKGN